MTTALPAAKTNGADHQPAPLTCSRPGCKRTLSSTNASGLCRDHRSHSKKKTAAAVAGSAKPAGGFSEKTSPQAVLTVAAERAKLLMAAIPMEEILAAIPLDDKLQFVERWLSGE